MNYRIKELGKIIDAQIFGVDNNPFINTIYFDSRKIINGENALFFALKGKQKSGEDFIQDAYEKGVRVFVTKKPIDSLLSDSVFLVVKDPLKSLQVLSKYHREKFELDIIGITGSNGKTVVKEWLNQLLFSQFNLIRSPKSYNSQIGVPLSVLQIHENHELGIIEVGISQTNEMQQLQEIVQPKIGVFTNIGSAHSQGFKDKSEHIKEKLKLFKNAEILVYSDDDALVRDLVESDCDHKKKISFGTQDSSVVSLLEIDSKSLNSILKIKVKDKIFLIEIPFVDKASIQNTLCCIGVLYALNLNISEFKTIFKELNSIEMRLEIRQAIRNSILINDSFNSDLQSVKIALELLSQQSKTNKIVVLTDLEDISIPTQELYQQLAEIVNQFPVDGLVLIGNHLVRFKNQFNRVLNSYVNTTDFLNDIRSFEFQDSAILLKGARRFALEDVAQILERQTHDTILEIKLDALVDNLNYFRTLLKPSTKVMAMVKAFSYGTGDYEIAHTLANQNIDYLGVAYADEGVELRKAGIRLPIIVMNPEQSSYGMIIRYGLEPEIYSFRVLNLFVEEIQKSGYQGLYPIHIKINTGMNRLGFKRNEIQLLAKELKKNKRLKVQSIFTHLAASDDSNEKEFTLHQIDRFNDAYQHLSNSLNTQPIRHILNSSGVINYSEYQYDMVRLGIGLYGYSSDVKTQKELRNLVEFKTVISQLNELMPGDTVSYNRKFKASKNCKIATLPVGYADGINRRLGNGKGYVSIHNKKAKILGSICMDMMMVNVSNIDCHEGDEVTIFGEKPSINEVANQLKTIPYEILTSISQRVKRVYYKE